MTTNEMISNGLQQQVDAQATEWFMRIRDGELSDEELNAWRCWLEMDVAHEQAFQSVEVLWQTLDELDELPMPAESALQRDSYEGDVPVSQWREGTQPSATGGGTVVQMILDWVNDVSRVRVAAALASVIALSLVFVISKETATVDTAVESFQTAKAEHKSVTLADGSVVELGAESILTVRFIDHQRNVNLVRGEAFFQVASDNSRPFTVQMGNGFARVVGTAFNIDRDSRGSTITVLEGSVQVAVTRKALDQTVETTPDRVAQLKAGEQLILADIDGLGTVTTVDTESAVAWRQGLLAFVAQPLGDVVSELNRYSQQRIILASASVEQMVFTGTVNRGRIDEWLQGLQKAYPVRISVIDEKTVLLFDKQQ